MSLALAFLHDGSTRGEARGDLVIPWWSFGKTLIAATALRLCEQGRLGLDRPVEGMTLRQLLRHESGLADYGAVQAYHLAVAQGETAWSRHEMLSRVGPERRLFPPGEGWAYSNIGYLRVRELIEQAYGDDLGAAAGDLVLRPLGVVGARLAIGPEDLTDVQMGSAQGYDPGWVYHGLFVGPLRDAAALLDGLFGPGSPLSTGSRTAMLAHRPLPQHSRPPWAMAGYGLGCMTPQMAQGWQAAGHTGGGPGSHIAVYRRLEGPASTAAVFAFATDQHSVEAAVVRLLTDGSLDSP